MWFRIEVVLPEAVWLAPSSPRWQRQYNATSGWWLRTRVIAHYAHVCEWACVRTGMCEMKNFHVWKCDIVYLRKYKNMAKTGKPRVGNRTNHAPESADKIKAMNQAYSAEVDEYKRFADARRNRRKYTQESMSVLYERVSAYVDECERTREPLTVAGMLLAMGTNKDMWSKAKAGEYDYLLEEYIALNNISAEDVQLIDNIPWHVAADAETGEIREVMLIPYSDFCENLSLRIEAQLERNCYTNKGNPAGSIFGLKAHYGYRDDPETPQHLVQNLVIADPEQVKKAAKMLTGLDT